MGDEVDEALHALFHAYDLDESGELSRREFLQIEMRLCFEAGEVFHEDARVAGMTLADADRSGTLDFQEFRERQLRTFHEMGMNRDEIVRHVQDHIRRTLAERVKMGPRYHADIRKALKRIFGLFDASGDGALSPEEWVAAQKVVAVEIGDEIDDDWLDEKAFCTADSNGDGVLDESEFLESSFAMFEGVKRRTDAILATLERIVERMEEERRSGDRRETLPLEIFVQAAEKPQFRPPRLAWQDEPTSEETDRNINAWRSAGVLALPMNLTTVEEVMSILRLFLHWPAETWGSAYFSGASRGGGPRPVTQIRGERAGEGNVQAVLDYLSKPHCVPKLYVKNMRKRPVRLTRQPCAFFEEREALIARRTGNCKGFDWETQLVGDGQLLPPRPLVVFIGDAVVVEVPQTDEHGEYRYVSSVYMDGTSVLSMPIEENIEPKKPKKKKRSAGPEPDPLLQFTLVALREGRCVFFVDVGWEDQEEKLCATHGLIAPCAENTVARIGPLEVEVQPRPGTTTSKDKTSFEWWNGEKWSNKKGPAKKKRR